MVLGAGRLIGVSAHGLEEAREAELAGADFVVFGPVYYTPSKAAYGAPQGITALKKIVENLTLPVYAIGGIKPENVQAVMAAGVRGIALISAVSAAPDPRSAAATMVDLLERP
jgi:thiamine-phosphate pyrophosphorylase